MAAKLPLVLASGSPRRVMLLHELDIPFTQVIPQIEEKRYPDEAPDTYAERLAKEKAQTGQRMSSPEAVVIGCDTIVVLDNRVLEKPDSPEHALEMLSRLVGRRHTVCSAVALAGPENRIVAGCERTDVYFNHVQREQLLEYIRSGEPLDKAGAYGIQGAGGFLVDRIEGNLDTVIGLPRRLLDALAGQMLSLLQEV
ncbi:MAG: septum formation inhibitor Maf [Candidatus Zixiibacteriota bacterium]|nr:MAG: septum formation inhibitor Maf [candidate division Zixibacteria bacterium]